MKFELKEYHFDVSDQDLIVDLKRVAKELQKEAISLKSVVYSIHKRRAVYCTMA